MNLYQSMMLRPQTPASVAASVLGARAPNAVPPSVPDVSLLFSKAGIARGSVNPTDRYLFGQYGSGLNGFGGFGGFGEVAGRPVFPGAPAGLIGADTPDVWAGSDQAFDQNGWTPPSGNVIADAATVWRAIQASPAPADMAFAEAMTNTLKAQAAELDQAVGDHGLGHNYAQAAINRVMAALGALKATVISISQYRVTVPSVDPTTGAINPTAPSTLPGTFTDPAANPVAQAQQASLVLALQKAQAAEAQQQAQQQAQLLLAQQQGSATGTPGAVASGLPSWLLPAGIGVLVLGVGAVVLLKKKK